MTAPLRQLAEKARDALADAQAIYAREGQSLAWTKANAVSMNAHYELRAALTPAVVLALLDDQDRYRFIIADPALLARINAEAIGTNSFDRLVDAALHAAVSEPSTSPEVTPSDVKDIWGRF